MTRSAILIGAPNVRNRHGFLPGVEQDIFSFSKFLNSPAGGGWHKEEIFTFKNPLTMDLLNRIKSVKSDYSLIYFSGHGSIQNSSTTLRINPREDLNINQLITQSPKQLIIIDACRTFIEIEDLSYLGETIEKGFSTGLSIAQSRRIFNSHLNKCDDGIVVCFSCSPGEASLENPYGGYFTSSLLKCSIEWSNTLSDYSILPINSAFEKSKTYLKRNFITNQNPSLIGERRLNWFPFVIKERSL